MKKFLFKDEGSALPAVMIIMLIVMIFVVSLLNTSLADSKHAVRSELKTQSHYLGRSGVNVGLEMLYEKTPYDDTIDELIDELNLWANAVSPVVVNTNEEFQLSFEKIGPREIKITSIGKVLGNLNIEDTVTLRVRMLTSLLTGGKANDWYQGNSSNLIASNDPASGGVSYIGKGIYLEGKNNSSTHFPSNAGGGSGESIFQASVMQLLENNNDVSLNYSGNTQNTKFDAEIIIINGMVVLNDSIGLILQISDTVALNKINNTPESILYINDTATLNSISTNGNLSGVGFEYYDYYKYFVGSSYVNHSTYSFIASPYTRYGAVYLGDKVVRANNESQAASASDRLPIVDTSVYAKGYYYYPHNINLNDSTINLSNLLIPMRKDDPLVEIIEVISKVTVSSQPYIWDNK